ncbi:MAG: acetylxylan esterase, partial [Candidatus Glassbacteria bacterium]
MKTVRRLFFLALVLLAPASVSAQNELKVYRDPADQLAASQTLYNYLTGLAWDYLDAREREIAAIKSPGQVAERQKLVREKILATLGPLPEKTELKPRVTGRLERDGYFVENVVFQSQPGFYVTANLYVPSRGKKPFPAVLGTCGHTLDGKASGVYQTVWIDLVKEGFVVLTFDPPGQGERLMYWDPDLGQTWLEGTTTEHSLPGIQCLLTGANAATYFIWDMIRCIDYLESRPEVDPKRLAVTGNSGGGMMSAYIAAVDTRLAAAVPSCYMTGWRRLWATIGPQDAEQNMLPFIGSGLDFGDYALAFAPKPYLMNTAIRDFFSIVGARETLAEVKRIYGILGAENKVAQFEADDYHGYTRPRREACVRWLRKHLLAVDEAYAESEPVLEKERDLWATPTGQVLTSFKDAGTIGTLNAAFARRIGYKPGMPANGAELERRREKLIAKVKELTGFTRCEGELDIQLRGYVRRPGMTVEQLTYLSEPGIEIPALLCRPDNPAGDLPAVLYVPAEGKADEIGEDISALAAAGHIVLVPDVRGKGETARLSKRDDLFQKWFSPDWDMALMAFHVRKSLVGMRAADL